MVDLVRVFREGDRGRGSLLETLAHTHDWSRRVVQVSERSAPSPHRLLSLLFFFLVP